MDSLASCSFVTSSVRASKVTCPEPSLWECSEIRHTCPAEPHCGSELMVYFHGKEDTNLYLEHPITQAESTGVTVTSLGFKPISNLIMENKSKQIPKFPRRENPEIKEFQETKSFSGNSSITNHHTIAEEPMDIIHRLDYSTVNCPAIRD